MTYSFERLLACRSGLAATTVPALLRVETQAAQAPWLHMRRQALTQRTKSRKYWSWCQSCGMYLGQVKHNFVSFT